MGSRAQPWPRPPHAPLAPCRVLGEAHAGAGQTFTRVTGWREPLAAAERHAHDGGSRRLGHGRERTELPATPRTSRWEGTHPRRELGADSPTASGRSRDTHNPYATATPPAVARKRAAIGHPRAPERRQGERSVLRRKGLNAQKGPSAPPRPAVGATSARPASSVVQHPHAADPDCAARRRRILGRRTLERRWDDGRSGHACHASADRPLLNRARFVTTPRPSA
jgi:hypothetical protein